MYFNAEFPTDAVRTVISNIRTGNYVGAETVDAAVYALGCANAFRQSEPTPLGDSSEDYTDLTDEQVCTKLETHLDESGDGALKAGTGLPPWAWTLIIEIARRVLDRL